MDEFVDQLLHEEYVCNVAMPRLQNRYNLENLGHLSPRKSALEEILEDEEDEEEDE